MCAKAMINPASATAERSMTSKSEPSHTMHTPSADIIADIDSFFVAFIFSPSAAGYQVAAHTFTAAVCAPKRRAAIAGVVCVLTVI